MTEKIIFFDTTLRDGEQSPGCQMNPEEKLDVAVKLYELGVDIIEAGFPISSPGDFEAVRGISKRFSNEGPVICGLARTKKEDIQAAYHAISSAQRPRIHTFISTSPIHMEKKLRVPPSRVLETVADQVKYARSLVGDVEFSAEDATRSDRDYLSRIVETAINGGATTINFPDTVGFINPQDFVDLINYVRNNVPNIDKAVLSVHCHNDRGLAVINTLKAIQDAGVRQAEVTINGLGERAGNAALEQVAANLMLEGDYSFSIDTRKVKETSELVSMITGVNPQPNSPIVGANAFKHQSGVHQHGVMQAGITYEVISPEVFGYKRDISLGARSGRAGFARRLEDLGIKYTSDELDNAAIRFTKITDRKKVVDDADVISAMSGVDEIPEHYQFMGYTPTKTGPEEYESLVEIRINGDSRQLIGKGNGLIDAVVNGIKHAIAREDIYVQHFDSRSSQSGSDAKAYTEVDVSKNGYLAKSRQTNTDTITSAANAFLDGANRIRFIEGYVSQRE